MIVRFFTRISLDLVPRSTKVPSGGTDRLSPETPTKRRHERSTRMSTMLTDLIQLLQDAHTHHPGDDRRLMVAVPTTPPELWPQLFSDVNCIALWISSEKILTRLYSVLHWFHKRLEVNVKNPRENRCFQNVIVFSFGSVDNSNKCTVLWKIAVRLIAVSTSVNNELWVKLRRHRTVRGKGSPP
jgi:hypothetical protein